jgi:hypothetical protein
MIHTRLQLDPNAQVTVRDGAEGTYEILVLEPAGDASAVINVTPEHLDAICKALGR